MEYVVELNNIIKKFDTNVILSNISIKVKKNEIFGLLGPSGAGKTTIIKILTGQLFQTQGESLVFGIPSEKLKANEYSKIGMVMDNCGLYERLTAYDNIYIFAKIFSIPTARITEVLKEVELDSEKNKTVSTFSKGMKQRLVLARAMLHKPELLFLDEPTSGLDPATAGKIRDIMFSMRNVGTTIFLTTHNMDEAAKMCNNIALLNKGNIVEYGSPAEICERHNLEKIITVILNDKSKLAFSYDSDSVEKIYKLLKTGNINSIHSLEPDLESVFIKLTGRRLV